MKLQLKHPIQVGKTEITSLTFREFTTAADYLAFDQKGGVAQTIALIASLAGTDENVIKLLHGADYKRAKNYADELLDQDEKDAEDSEGGEKKLPES